MYEIAVLEAGSAAALSRWLDDHGYVYPDGMDEPCNDYVRDGWCFVAVKTRVGQKRGVDPKPGMRGVDSKLPEGASFDGNVQARTTANAKPTVESLQQHTHPNRSCPDPHGIKLTYCHDLRFQWIGCSGYMKEMKVSQNEQHSTNTGTTRS